MYSVILIKAIIIKKIKKQHDLNYFWEASEIFWFYFKGALTLLIFSAIREDDFRHDRMTAERENIRTALAGT